MLNWMHCGRHQYQGRARPLFDFKRFCNVCREAVAGSKTSKWLLQN
jgi:hypothetical protein